MIGAVLASPMVAHVDCNTEVTKSAYTATLDDQRLLVEEMIARFTFLPVRPKKVVVELKPRTFNEIANHFRSVTTPIEWPVDDPDID